MENVSMIQIDDLLYPTLEVRTVSGHDPRGDRAGTVLKFGRKVQKFEGQPGKYELMVTVSSDDEKSKNTPYAFKIDAYALVSIGGAALEGDAASAFIFANGMPIVMGAIRERLAEATARMPWGRFLINAVPMTEPLQIRAL